MNYDFLVDAELDRVDWTKVQEASGSAAKIPDAFRQLLAATNDQEMKAAYWKLENHVVVQGHLYEASIHIVPAVCAALASPNRSHLVRSWVIELLFQICNGYGPVDIVEHCRIRARNALWILYLDLAKQEIKVVESLISVLENDPERLALVKKKIPNYKLPIWSATPDL